MGRGRKLDPRTHAYATPPDSLSSLSSRPTCQAPFLAKSPLPPCILCSGLDAHRHDSHPLHALGPLLELGDSSYADPAYRCC
jgi:hypothetical protein